MSPPPEPSAAHAQERRFFVRPPLAVVAVALFAALLHMLPWWHALAQTPPDWTFTGNVTVSPDAMQYRVWMRQALEQGLVVDDRFTSEPHEAFLPVAYYWAVAHLGRLTGLSPEWANAWVGVPLAALFALLSWWTVRYFVGPGGVGWLVYLGMLFGGGLTAHLKLLPKLPAIASLPVVRGLVAAAHSDAPTFEESRFHYLIRTLYDSHFLLIWLWTLAAVLSLYFALRRPAPWRSALTALLFAGITLVHVYEGVTLLVIAAGVALLCWRKGLALRPALATLALAGLAVGACFALLYSLQQRCGLPFPTWAAPSFPVSNLFLAFPLAWIVIAWGLARTWREAGLEECFLLGWAAGCTLLLLSHPYYPYHDRGAVTAQVVLNVLAGAIWVRRVGGLSPRVALLALAVLGAAPLYVTHFWWRATDFDAAKPWLFQSPSDRELVEALARRAGPDDVLLAPDRDYRWLYPEYPGRSYDAHFFLTVDFARKQAAKARFFEDGPQAQADFLREEGIRFLYVGQDRDPARFARLPGLTTLFEGGRGRVFEVERDADVDPR